jgi:hypothetical protein
MTRMTRLTAVLVAVGLGGCRDAAAPGNGPVASRAAQPALSQQVGEDQVDARATGRGVFSLAGLNVDFAFRATQEGGEAAHGKFHQRADEGGGLIIDFDATVTCLAVDPVNHRAWIGGVVTENESTDPDYMTAINQPGQDIWFRVLDGGDGPGATDRSTFLGFQNPLGFLTSAAYCAARPWPADNMRTWPVTSGELSVRP